MLKQAFASSLMLATLLLCAPAQASVNIFACEPTWGALSKTLGGDLVDVYTATSPLQDPHHVQARPSLIAKMHQADLVVCLGAQLEIGWLPLLLRKANNPHVQPATPGYFEASKYVTMLQVPDVVDRAQGDIHPDGNPHIQTDPRNIAQVAKALAKRLAVVDKAHAATYAKTYAAFAQRWQAAITKWQQAAAPLKGVNVISAHKSWAYLFNWLGIHEVATLEPKPGVPPSAGYLETLLQGLKTHPATMIIRAAYYDPQSSQWLADKSGLPVVVLPFEVGGTPDSDGLFKLYDATIAHLLKALP